jgi:adenylate kinase
MIIVLGTPGAGKTTVLPKATEGFGSTEVNYGDLMLEIAMRESMATDRDGMRKMPLEKQKELQFAVAKKLGGLEGRVILDTHALVSTPAGYLPGIPGILFENVNVEQLILITSPPRDVVRRRSEDKSRTRDDESEEQLAEITGINKSYLFAYSALSGAPAAVVENADGKLEEAVRRIRGILEERWHER